MNLVEIFFFRNSNSIFETASWSERPPTIRRAFANGKNWLIIDLYDSKDQASLNLKQICARL